MRQPAARTGPAPIRLPPRHAIPAVATLAALATTGSFIAIGNPAAAQSAPVTTQATPPQQVEIIGTSPLPGLGVDRNTLPYASQVVRRGAIDAAQTEHLSDHLRRRMPGMQVSDIQGSPLQPDLTYRGQRASGLLGAGQGLSVYLDGVRVNEPFGDVVNWDLVPEFALDSLTVLPAANPAFGLNTLGGAIVLRTADGRSAPGVEAEVRGGSHGRLQANASLGQARAGGWHSYVGAAAFGEDGWRAHSRSEQALVMAKLGRQLGSSDWSVAVLGGRSTLVGNGLLPSVTLSDVGQATPDLYAHQRHAVFTHPDRTRNALSQITARWSEQLGPQRKAEALIYARSSRRETLNGDLAEEEGDEAAAGGAGVSAPGPDRAALADLDDDSAFGDGALNTTQTRQQSWGMAASLAGQQAGHQWQLGATLDVARVRYAQQEQAGLLDASRGVVAGADPAALSASVTGRSTSLGLYATDTWRLASATHLTATLRANHTVVSNRLTTRDDDTGLLEVKPQERFTYNSLNPAIGIAHALSPQTTVFANLARNTRVPTVIELGCADPEEPCRLPVGLQSDPYLKPVRAIGLEAGWRWQPAAGQRLEVALYRNDNRDDIVFTSVSATGQLGYFQNFGRTRHQGVDATWEARYGPLAVQAGYSHLDATYQASGTLRMGERNVSIAPGTRIAGLPRHSARLSADWRLNAAVSLGADAQWLSGRTVQGNEDGLLADGAADRHDLRIPGYGVLNLRGSWRTASGIEWLLSVSNLLDRRYETYGALAETVFDAQGRFTGDAREALFVAPGAPRSIYGGLRLRF